MKIVKIVGKIFFTIAGLLLLLLLMVNILGTRSDLVSGVTGNKLKATKPGMTLEQVISILGMPYQMEASQGLHLLECKKSRDRLVIDLDNNIDIKATVDNYYSDTNYCCEGNREDMKNKKVTLTYSRPVKFSKYYPMIWIHLDSNYQVSSVYAKRYDGFLGMDDPGIYGSSWDFDEITGNPIIGRTRDFINQKAFSACFK